MKTYLNKLEELYERLNDDFKIDTSLTRLNRGTGELFYTAPNGDGGYEPYTGQLCNVDLYYALCRLASISSNLIASEAPLPEVQNIEVLFRAWYKMNRESLLEEGKSAADVMKIASVYLNINTVLNPYNSNKEEYYFGLAVTLQNSKAIPLLAQFKEDGTLMPTTYSSLGDIATYYYGDVGEVKRYSTRELITHWAKEYNKGNSQSYILGDNVLGFILNFNSSYMSPLDNLALSMGRKEGFSLMKFTMNNFLELPAKSAHLWPAPSLSFSFLFDFLKLFDNIVNTRVRGVVKTVPTNKETEDKAMFKETIEPQESIDTQEDGAAKKERPCASCIHTILKNADLGINDFQRYAIVGLMAMAFDMEIPD